MGLACFYDSDDNPVRRQYSHEARPVLRNDRREAPAPRPVFCPK